MHCGVVIVAAGSSRRMGERDKISQILMGRPVIDWVLDAFVGTSGIEEYVVVVGRQNERAIRQALQARRGLQRVICCRGGASRRDSVAAGVARLSPAVDLVMVHDGARPMVTRELIGAAIACGERWGAAIPAVPVADTIKEVGADGAVRRTLVRDELRAVQTPQVFRRDWLEFAYREQDESPEITDEAMLLEMAGYTVHVFPGSSENLKLTTPTDLLLAEAILRRRVGGWVA